MRLITRSKDISLDGLSGDLRLQDNNGSVEVGLHKPGNIQIENRKGDVQITIPPNTALKVEARSRGGEISSDFTELQVNNADGQRAPADRSAAMVQPWQSTANTEQSRFAEEPWQSSRQRRPLFRAAREACQAQQIPARAEGRACRERKLIPPARIISM